MCLPKAYVVILGHSASCTPSLQVTSMPHKEDPVSPPPKVFLAVCSLTRENTGSLDMGNEAGYSPLLMDKLINEDSKKGSGISLSSTLI